MTAVVGVSIKMYNYKIVNTVYFNDSKYLKKY